VNEGGVHNRARGDPNPSLLQVPIPRLQHLPAHLAFVGCAVARGEWHGPLAVALVFVALWRKLRLEEKWVRAQFGESYEAYSRRVAALVPHVI
jgi:protein-S-isoprenylcysteine O-methyltransferase Ste14